MRDFVNLLFDLLLSHWYTAGKESPEWLRHAYLHWNGFDPDEFGKSIAGEAKAMLTILYPDGTTKDVHPPKAWQPDKWPARCLWCERPALGNTGLCHVHLND